MSKGHEHGEGVLNGFVPSGGRCEYQVVPIQVLDPAQAPDNVLGIGGCNLMEPRHEDHTKFGPIADRERIHGSEDIEKVRLVDTVWPRHRCDVLEKRPNDQVELAVVV